jgi:hypothetical protein
VNLALQQMKAICESIGTTTIVSMTSADAISRLFDILDAGPALTHLPYLGSLSTAPDFLNINATIGR